MVVRTSTCGYRNEDWPTNHSCLRHTGHPNRHRCWCGETHDHRESSGRWENYIPPEFDGKKVEPREGG